MKKRANTLRLHLCLPKGVDLNVHLSQPLDQHPGNIPADQTLVVVTMMEVAVVAVAEDHQLGETQTTIQVLTIIQKWIEKGIALPFVVLLHQQDVTSGSDPHGTHNADKDGGPSGPRRHGLELVRRSETWMSERMPKQTSKQSWMARVRIVTRTRTEV
jgi:hypothetical protein